MPNYKPWTPDNCPLKPGDVIHDGYYNNDILVLKRFLSWDEKDDNTNKPLISVCLAGMVITLTGKELSDNRWEWYPNWPDTGTTEPCCTIDKWTRERIKARFNEYVQEMESVINNPVNSNKEIVAELAASCFTGDEEVSNE